MEPRGLQIWALQVIRVPLVKHPSVPKLFLDMQLGLFTHRIGTRQRGRGWLLPERGCLGGHRDAAVSVLG